MTRCNGWIWPADAFLPEVDEEQCLLLNDMPTCPYCRGMTRPNVMMFNDWGWQEQREPAPLSTGFPSLAFRLSRLHAHSEA
jgi:hypothetical protein